MSVFKIQGSMVTRIGEGLLGPNAHVVAVDPATHRSYFPLRNLNGKTVSCRIAPGCVEFKEKLSNMRILLVEDDPMIGEAVSVALKDAAYAVDWVKDGASASQTLESDEHQAVLLDLGLPKRDGLEVLRLLRLSEKQVPIIIITARDDVENRIKGLDLGADDYLVKPFDLNELLARLRAVVRRRGGQGNPILTNGIISLDPATREARRGDASHLLSAREFALLHALMLRPGAILTRTELEERIYGWNEEVESNVVDFLIHSVRKKLGMDAIKNIRGAGWMVAKS